MNGADAVLRSLEAEGVEVCFGIPGGSILALGEAGATPEEIRARIGR